jgi:hypothetical protein
LQQLLVLLKWSRKAVGLSLQAIGRMNWSFFSWDILICNFFLHCLRPDQKCPICGAGGASSCTFAGATAHHSWVAPEPPCK